MHKKGKSTFQISEKQFIFRVLTIMITILLGSISSFIISRFNCKYNDDWGVIFTYFGGIIITLIISVFGLLFLLFLIFLPYFLLTEGLGVDKEESRLVSYYENFGDLEAGNYIMMIFRVIFIIGYYFLIYVVIGPSIYGVNE